MKEVDLNIGEYTVLHKIGKGGMSIVYKAWHEPTCRVVALKRILPEIIVYEEAKNLFRREAFIMRNLIHSNIVRLIEYTMGEKECYFILENLSGGDLHTYIQKNLTTLTKICTILCGVLDGIDYLHKKGLIHGDIKPHNILMSHTGTGKLSDFNLARSFGEFNISNPDRISKTPIFMAPEEVVNIKNVDPTIDIYCMGMSMYYIFTENFPLTIPKPKEMIKAFLKEKKHKNLISAVINHEEELKSKYTEITSEIILKEDRVPVLNYRRDLPDELAHIIDKAVKKDKEDRFKSAREMKDTLKTFLSRYEENLT
ncbi:MAG: serine/threonine-protein kinase [Candidatus Methanofastidiosia archaeon]